MTGQTFSKERAFVKETCLFHISRIVTETCSCMSSGFARPLQVFSLTRMKLGLFLFLQLKDGTLISGYLLSWRTSQPLWVCPLRMRRGLNHCSSWGEKSVLNLNPCFRHTGSCNSTLIRHLKFFWSAQQKCKVMRKCEWLCGAPTHPTTHPPTRCEASLDSTSYFSLNSRCLSSGSAASSPLQPASLSLYRG